MIQEYCKHLLIESPYVLVISNDNDPSCHAAALIRSSISLNTTSSASNSSNSPQPLSSLVNQHIDNCDDDLDKVSPDTIGETDILYSTPRNVVVFCKYICKSIIEKYEGTTNRKCSGNVESSGYYGLVSAMVFR